MLKQKFTVEVNNIELDLGFIKSRRIKLELTLQNVAEQLGFKNASTYLKYENGDYLFRANMLPRLHCFRIKRILKIDC